MQLVQVGIKMYSSLFLLLFVLSTGFNFCLATRSCQPNCYKSKTLRLSGNFPPPFVTFTKNGSVDTSKINDYARYYCKNKVDGVVVNAVQAGGQLLTLAEKKTVLDAWLEGKKICNLTVVCQLGRMNYQILRDLAAYAKRVGVDAIEVGAGSLYEANSTIAVVGFVASIAKIVYPIKVIFYDRRIDPFNYNMATFFGLALKIPNFVGIKTKFRSCQTVLSRNQLNKNLILWSYDSYDLTGAYAFCINGTSTQVANVFTAWSVMIKNYAENGDFIAADNLQNRMNKAVGACLGLLGIEKVDGTAYAYEEQVLRYMMELLTGMKVGLARYPYPQLSAQIQKQCASRLRAQGII